MPAGNTYSTIATITADGTSASQTFTSIPSTYTDLILVANFGLPANNSLKIRVGNGSIDTGSNYSYTYTYGNGTSALSTNGTNDNGIYAGYSGTSNIQMMWNMSLQSYSSTTTKKTMLNRYNDPAGAPVMVAGIWNSTSAINQIRAFSLGDPFSAGSTFTLYGITAA